MITANIKVTDGLVNGSMGTLKYVKREDNNSTVRLRLQFPSLVVGIKARAKAQPIHQSNPRVHMNWVPIGQRAVTIVVIAKDTVSFRRTVSFHTDKRNHDSQVSRSQLQ
ncbi:hypothetical protein HPB49_000268 [Dermacentor silvarum]|uniref:Uncharacterized protein n=1 Tax=Dermacentor silvarum TaxID=543639 RepID=A0ACB8DHW9_DERSI|nr:hypothetical protein HPB49_000268 [Dermacentor silvarum]